MSEGTKKYRKAESEKMARELFKEGILLGDELVEYVNATHIKFKNEEDVFDFCDMILESIDRRSIYLEVVDLETKKTYKFSSFVAVGKALGVSDAAVGQAYGRGNPLYGRFKMSKKKWGLESMKKGITYKEIAIEYEREKRRYGKIVDAKVRVVDIETGLGKVFTTGRRACNFFGIDSYKLSQYIRGGFRHKKRFMFELLEDIG